MIQFNHIEKGDEIMGMYTKLHCNIKIKKDATECIDILEYMLSDNDDEYYGKLPDHDFFMTARWRFMLQCSSFYFTGTNNSSLKETSNYYVLHCDCDLKDYDNEIELFLDWISQYTNYYGTELAGYKRYEEEDIPTLIYFNNKHKFKLILLNSEILK